MEAVNVRQLKNNPSTALRKAHEGPVLVLKGDRPEALILHLDFETLEDAPTVRVALASSLYKDGMLSLGRASRVAELSVAAFIDHLGSIGVPIGVTTPAEVDDGLDHLDAWSSRR